MKFIGWILIFALDLISWPLLAVLFFLTFVGVQVASWTGRKE